jgi:hypothetical protein
MRMSQFPVTGTAKGGSSNREFVKPYVGGAKKGEILRITQSGIVLLPEGSSQKSAKNSSMGMYSGSKVNLGGALETGSRHRLQCFNIPSITSS